MQVKGLTKRLAVAAAVIVGAALGVPAANANVFYNFSGGFWSPRIYRHCIAGRGWRAGA